MAVATARVQGNLVAEWKRRLSTIAEAKNKAASRFADQWRVLENEEKMVQNWISESEEQNAP